jgi:putative transposase
VSFRSSNKTVYSAKYHLIWCPKYRRPVLSGPVEVRLVELVRQICVELPAEILEFEVMADHVPLLVEIPPAVALSRFIGLVKGRTSAVLGHEFGPLRRLAAPWSASWFCSTVAGAPLEVVVRDVENHKQAA